MLMSSHTSPGPYPIGRLFGFQGTNALHYIWTNGYGLWTRCLKSPLIMFGQRGTKKEVCFDFFLKKTIQLLSHEMARLWGIREKNTKCAVHIWEFVKSPSISYRNIEGQKTTHNFKKSPHPSTATFRLRNGQGIRKFSLTTLLRHKCGKTKPMLGKKAYP